MGDEWDDSLQSKEQIEANLLSKYEAAMRRERTLAYSFSHQVTFSSILFWQISACSSENKNGIGKWKTRVKETVILGPFLIFPATTAIKKHRQGKYGK